LRFQKDVFASAEQMIYNPHCSPHTSLLVGQANKNAHVSVELNMFWFFVGLLFFKKIIDTNLPTLK
jgi:hypothetical protein